MNRQPSTFTVWRCTCGSYGPHDCDENGACEECGKPMYRVEMVPADDYRQLRQAAIEFESDLSEYCDGPARDHLRELLHGEAA